MDLAEPVAADIALSLHQLAEAAGVDLGLDPAEMTLAPALIAERQHHAGGLADARNLAALRDRVSDRLVEENVLAGVGSHAGGGEMHAVRRRIGDGLASGVGEDFPPGGGGPPSGFAGR